LLENLYYRLNAFILHIPPLRERREEVPILLKAFHDPACRSSAPALRCTFLPNCCRRAPVIPDRKIFASWATSSNVA
jgi:transcriptional regulator of aromatic amino acid metabolism